MYQQQGIRFLEVLRAPRVGIGAFGIGIAAAFVAGAIVISLLAGSHTALSSQVRTTVAAPPAAARYRGLNVEDFGTTPRAATSIAAPAVRSGLNVEDFGTTPQGR